VKAKIAVAVLGVGRMGLIHCESIAATSGLSLVAASSRSPERLAAALQRFDLTGYRSHEELLADPRVEWVVIATTTDEHKEWALKALKAGKRLIIEKPVGLSYEEAAAIFEEADKRNLEVTVHQNRRWDRDFQVVRAVLRDSLLGEVYRIESRYTSFSSGWAGWGAQGMANPWRLKRKYGGGLLSDWGPHLLDQALLLVNSEVRSLFAGMYGRIWTREVDDHFWVELTFADGRSLRAEASNNSRIPLPRWYILGTAGTLQVRGGELTDWDAAVIRKEFNGFPQEIRIDIGQLMLSTGFYAEFAEAARSGKKLPVSAAEVLRVMRLMDAVRESASSGRSVSFNDNRE
jgi:predicted dehydrogenase